MEQNLEFLDSFSIENFKAMQNSSKVEVKQNPKTSKLFFSWGPSRSQIGAVSKKGIPTNPIVSLVRDAEGREFYLLHEEAQGTPTLATF